MVRCPICGSTAQPKVIKTEYVEDGWELEVIRTYKCGCGGLFTGTSYYEATECEEYFEELPKNA